MLVKIYSPEPILIPRAKVAPMLSVVPDISIYSLDGMISLGLSGTFPMQKACSAHTSGLTITGSLLRYLYSARRCLSAWAGDSLICSILLRFKPDGRIYYSGAGWKMQSCDSFRSISGCVADSADSRVQLSINISDFENSVIFQFKIQILIPS